MARNAATAKVSTTDDVEATASVKLSSIDRQRISNLRAMSASIKSVIAAIASGDVDETGDMMTILAAQFQLVTQLGIIAARGNKPVSAPPMVPAA